MKRVFISGPIQGMESDQSYREAIRSICLRCGFEPIDPWLRERVIYRKGKTEVSSFDFIKRDLEDIERCDILVAYMPRLSAGTCMELFYAKLKGKKTITICKIKDPSPWIIAHSDIIIRDIRDLEKHLK
ncbi:MAG TPA: DUF4062 domain-containing protein [Candidatus Bathyarchaeota archaeon]|nr:DUF4062 domain-containing protein [Candidatus Bathyarchaeota archaeon]